MLTYDRVDKSIHLDTEYSFQLVLLDRVSSSLVRIYGFLDIFKFSFVVPSVELTCMSSACTV